MSQTTLMESGAETMSDTTGTTSCDVCGTLGRDETGGHPLCPVDECYRGRVSGYRDTGRFLRDADGDPAEPIYDVVPCSAEQRAAVDRWLAEHRGR